MRTTLCRILKTGITTNSNISSTTFISKASKRSKMNGEERTVGRRGGNTSGAAIRCRAFRRIRIFDMIAVQLDVPVFLNGGVGRVQTP
ncbi:unnamed protein product [Rhizoctonia solani]|uniref:Uncharacterized protein n=1 Tax=Rhizoctonia solani TaxID=456999 RepID=A0A8H3GXT2_9AGAM|nr:unnamed protein product [Rhizoctonia solani]